MIVAISVEIKIPVEFEVNAKIVADEFVEKPDIVAIVSAEELRAVVIG